MKQSAIAQLLNNCDITESKVVIGITLPDGTSKEGIVLKDTDDFLNETIQEGTKVNLVFVNTKIYTGLFDSLEDEDGEYVIYIRPAENTTMVFGFPFDKCVGYYLEEAV